MQSIELLAHEFGRFAGMGLASVLAAAGAINTSMAETPAQPSNALAAPAPMIQQYVAPEAPAAEAAHISFNSPMPGFAINSRFGPRKLPGEAPRMHQGVDFAAPTGAPIRATTAGYVVKAGYSPTYGNFVEVDHGEGVTSFYAHMTRRAAGLKEGSQVGAGQTVGFVGSTGHSTGPHLHFEIRKDERKYDPMKVLGQQFASLSDLPFVRASVSGARKASTYSTGIIRGRVRS